MTPKPLAQIRCIRLDHKAALWWLGLLYRRPARFQASLKTLSSAQSRKAAWALYFHALAYIVGLSVVGRLVVFGLWGSAVKQPATTLDEIFLFHFKQIALALGASAAVALLGRNDGSSLPVRMGGGIILGIALGIVGGSVEGMIIAIAGGLALGLALGIALQPTTGESLGGVLIIIFAGSAFARLVEIPVGIALGTSAIISYLRVYYLPVSWWPAWPIPHEHWYRYHPVAWDDLCRLPFPGLSRLLVAYAETAPEKGEQEITRLIHAYPSQKQAALKAKLILLARKAARVTDLSQLDSLAARLPESKIGSLAQTPALRGLLDEIAQLQTRLNAITLPVLRESQAETLLGKIQTFRHRIAKFRQPLAGEFGRAAKHWLELAQQQWRQAKRITSTEPTPQVFRAGDPINHEQEAFVPRYGVVGDLEKQIMLAAGCPGLVLYGRRRTGKSTILRNLSGFLPATVTPIIISMQDPEAFTSLADWISLLARRLSSALGSPSFMPEAATDLSGIMRMLAACNAHLEETGKHILLAFDEYENFDRKLGEKVFSLDLLATLRESIFAHRNLTWIFAGSHEITELKHAEWPSYLVSARTIEVPLFTIAETRLLLTEPLKFSPLYKDESKRPRFAPGFWGESGVERIQHEGGGWPHLVQLIAGTVVDLSNDEDKRQVDDGLFERALNQAVVSGHNVLYQLLRGESVLPGEWDYLSAFRARETQPLPGEEALYVSLRRRLLMAEENNEWHLRVPLMARWLRQRG